MFHGSLVALVTPMDERGAIDFTAVDTLIDWHLHSGTDALVIAGTTGESATLTDDEKIQLIRHVVRTVRERIPVIAGTGAVATAHAVTLTKAAMQVGADACLLMTPAYVKPTQEGLFQHYQQIASQVAIPQILYNVPSRTACDLLPETVARLAELANVVGIKEATGDLERLKAIHTLCGNKIDIYSGDDITACEWMLNGAKGVISVTANVVPQAMSQLCQAALAGQSQVALEANEQLIVLHYALFAEPNPIPTKWALAQMNKIPTGIRLPLTPLSTAQQATVSNALRQLDLLT
ncbi:MAG: 4-hydroxy-tetrahydrodipicolinate synthase [Legionellales bacterium]|nr:4-hydroxy-tetrahydrodipicolinate synthase [Legionellales bacterium]